MSKKRQRHFKSGFSLIEFVIAIALMIIMTAVLFANQSKNKAQSDTESAARQVAVQLRSLQNDSLNGKQFGVDPQPPVPACSFNFNAAVADTTSYNISYNDCSGDQIAGSLQTMQLNSGKKNVTISSATVSFNVPWGQVSTSTSQIILTSKSDATVRASVCVCNSGNIFEQKGSGGCSC